MRTVGIVSAITFVACVALANLATAHYAPWHVAGLIITAGTWFAAVTFILRDVVQVAFGRAASYALIGGALAVDVIASKWIGDLAWITAGSALAFACSETIDAEVFTRYRSQIGRRVLGSGIAASIADSLIFCVVGLSPLTTGLVAWGDLWRVVLAQLVAKFVVVLVGSAISSRTLPQPVAAWSEHESDQRRVLARSYTSVPNSRWGEPGVWYSQEHADALEQLADTNRALHDIIARLNAHLAAISAALDEPCTTHQMLETKIRALIRAAGKGVA